MQVDQLPEAIGAVPVGKPFDELHPHDVVAPEGEELALGGGEVAGVDLPLPQGQARLEEPSPDGAVGPPGVSLQPPLVIGGQPLQEIGLHEDVGVEQVSKGHVEVPPQLLHLGELHVVNRLVAGDVPDVVVPDLQEIEELQGEVVGQHHLRGEPGHLRLNVGVVEIGSGQVGEDLGALGTGVGQPAQLLHAAIESSDDPERLFTL